jgi:uncharacterized protein YdeI (YjbR/CyaY-like superfamily)
MAPVEVNLAHLRSFASQADFEAWLGAHHDSAPEVWIRIFKKNSGEPSITPKEAIDVCLCWGWIDAIRKSWDERSFVQRYTPRRPRSIWSQVNRDNVERLIAAGQMREPGMRQVEAAKADGRWERAYASGSTMQTPADLLAAIEANPQALATYRTLSRQNQFAMAFRLGNLKTDAAREKKIVSFVEMLARGQTIYPQQAKP